MHATLRAHITICAHTGPACSSDSIDTLISLSQLNLAKIEAFACKQIVSMHANLNATVRLCCQTGWA